MELYVHIPFCLRKCAYCAFDSVAGWSPAQMEDYVSALLREASRREEYVTEPLRTVYIGGGTPSVLPPGQAERLLAGLQEILSFSQVDEFSVEANPGTVSPSWLETVRRFGVNRISFGMQAYQDRLLETLGRIHRYDEVVRSVRSARACGFSNISLDLIFGIPGQTSADWKETLDAALSLDPEHISAYGLIPEEGTPLYRDLESGVLSLPDPDLEREMYDTAIRTLSAAGYRQYEISNFALPGRECRHNIGYWDQVPYLGLGLSAASMVMSAPPSADCFCIRWTNPASFSEYNNLPDNPERFERLKEMISPEEARFETVMLSLRMTRGMSRRRFRDLHGNVPEFWYGDVLEKLRKQGLLDLAEDCWRLTRRGMDIQNSVLLEFMDDDQR